MTVKQLQDALEGKDPDAEVWLDVCIDEGERYLKLRAERCYVEPGEFCIDTEAAV